MSHDVIVIGGSYAGMAAALQLLRARRSVLVIDAGKRRNRNAAHAYAFIGQDGVDPAVIAADAKAQVLRYPTVTWIDASATAMSGAKDAFRVETDTGEAFKGRRVIFATGVADTLPDIPGLADRWGRHVFNCPYCHGFELNEGRIGVIATCDHSPHQAMLIPEWGQVTFFVNGRNVGADDRKGLTDRGVTIDDTPIDAIQGAADVVLTDGRVLSFAGIFIAPTNDPASDVPAGFGCAIATGPFGTMIEADHDKQTSVPGVYACGDAARVPHSLSMAVADGAWAGGQVHSDLVFG
jgi:thioredoxin reductase